MKTKFILIDYENVNTFSSEDLSVLKAEESVVKLFLGVHNREIGVDLVAALLAMASRVELIRVKTPGTNALDLLIAFYIGKLWSEHPEGAFYVISRDTDYNALIKNLKAIGVDAHRRKCIADITKDEQAAAPSMNELVEAAVAALQRVVHRPSTQVKLRNMVEQVFKKELSEEQLLELLSTLSRMGVVQIAGNKVTYHLPDPAPVETDRVLTRALEK